MPKKSKATDYDKLMADVPAGLGLEEVTMDDIQRSRLAIIQKGSPQLDSDEDAYIEGAKVGQIVDTALGIVYDNVDFVVIDYRTRWYEWKEDGGLVAIHDTEPQGVDREFKLPNGNKSSMTRVFTGWVLEPNSDERRVAFIPLSSTQLRKAKTWITQINNMKMPNGQKAPAFWSVYTLSSKKEFKPKGAFMGWRIKYRCTLEEYAAQVDENLGELFDEGMEVNKLIKKEMDRYLKSGFNQNMIPAESSAASEIQEEF